MARKAKKKLHAMPKLSLLDRLIYWVIFALLCLMWFGLGFLPIVLGKRIAFADEMVTAYREHASQLWMLIPWMTFFLITFILWLKPYQDRKPIFGLRNFKYGPPAWPKVYPLFMKDKPYVWVSQRSKQNRKTAAIALVILLLLSFIPLPWSFYGRDCLHTDGSIHRYNMFNAQTQEYDPWEIGSVRFTAYLHTTGGRYSSRWVWDVRVELVTDSGKTFSFGNEDFRYTGDSEVLYWLPAMLDLKDRYDPAIITFSGVEDLGHVIVQYSLTEQEAALLYQLFEIS